MPSYQPSDVREWGIEPQQRCIAGGSGRHRDRAAIRRCAGRSTRTRFHGVHESHAGDHCNCVSFIRSRRRGAPTNPFWNECAERTSVATMGVNPVRVWCAPFASWHQKSTSRRRAHVSEESAKKSTSPEARGAAKRRKDTLTRCPPLRAAPERCQKAMRKCSPRRADNRRFQGTMTAEAGVPQWRSASIACMARMPAEV